MRTALKRKAREITHSQFKQKAQELEDDWKTSFPDTDDA